MEDSLSIFTEVPPEIVPEKLSDIHPKFPEEILTEVSQEILPLIIFVSSSGNSCSRYSGNYFGTSPKNSKVLSRILPEVL